MTDAYIALGSNLGGRLGYLQRAVDALVALPGTQVLAISQVYETDPVGCAAQGAFLNAAAGVRTELSVRALLGACLGIEAALGRRREAALGPRVIDLDLLEYGDTRCGSAELILPHPRMMERAFVLRPLCDICPRADWTDALAALDQDGVRAFGGALRLPDGGEKSGDEFAPLLPYR